jgi:hypothetical protein
MAHRWNKLAGKQMMAVALLLEPSRREPAPEVERILIVYFAATQARAKGAAPSANREGGPDWGHCDQDSERLTSIHHRRSEQHVMPTGRDPHHSCCAIFIAQTTLVVSSSFHFRTVGVWYHGPSVTTQNSRYDRFTPAAND